MTTELDALVRAVLVPGFEGLAAPDWLRRQVAAGLGGVALFARNVAGLEQVRALTDSLRAERGDVLLALDEEGGDVTRLEAVPGSRHPAALALGHLDDLDVSRAVGRSLGALMAQAGCDWNWAPVVDVAVGGGNPAIGVRSFGSDPDLVARHGAALVRGLQDDSGMVACAKHFPGHLDADVDPHLGLAAADVSRSGLDAFGLAPFRACLAAGARSVMTAHVVMPSLDPEWPVTLSARAVSGVLRGELGFEGLVVSDALEMAGAARFGGVGEAAVRALGAGVDALCLGGALADEQVVLDVHRAVVGAVREGRLPEGRVVEAAHRVAALAAWRRRQDGTPRGGLLSDRDARVLVGGTVEVVGEPRLAAGDALVVDCTSDPLIASGRSGPSAADALVARRPATTVVTLTGPVDTAGLVQAASGRPLVVLVRDARQAWQRAVEHELVTARPDTVVVDLGVPSPDPAAGRARISTRGTTRWTSDTVAHLLVGDVPEEA